MYSIAVMQLYILICQKYAALRRIFDPIRIDDTYRVSDQMYRDTYRIGSSKRYTTLVSISKIDDCLKPNFNSDTWSRFYESSQAMQTYRSYFD